jgi:hypothetical chaperone protein
MIVAVGIDFGTTNSVVALADDRGGVRSLSWPTASGMTDTFRTALLFWAEGRGVQHVAGPMAIAGKLAGEQDNRFIQSIKTHLGSRLFTETRLFGHKFTLEDLVSTFLKDLIAQDLPTIRDSKLPIAAGRPVVFAGERADEALAVERLHRSFSAAGMDKITLAYEPLGAAYYYARALKHDETVLVADFGGGTSDFSIIRFSVDNEKLMAHPLAHSGVGIAGDTFDYRLLDHLVAPQLGKGSLYRSGDKRLPLPAYYHAAFAQWHQLSWLKTPKTLNELRRLVRDSEAPEALEDLLTMIESDAGFDLYQAISAVKAKLSVHTEAQLRFSREGVDITAHVTRTQFESWIADDLNKIEAAMDEAIQQAGLDPAGIDAVFLTGGTSLVPKVQEIFTRHFGDKKVHIGDAFQSVASGLALYARDLAIL